MAQTLADIAQKAGVSQATISRVVNGKPGVSDDMRKTVFDAMSSLGISKERFQRNDTRLVALVTPDLENPIFPKFTTELSTLLAQRRLLTILCPYTLGGTSEIGFLDLLQNQEIVGAIFLAGRYDTIDSDISIYQSFKERNIPMVFLNGPTREIDGLYVGTDVKIATNIALKHITSLGHRNIGMLLGDKKHYHSIVKYQAARKFFTANKIKHDSDMTTWTTYGVDSGQMAAKHLFEQGATAIVCANDQLALGAIKAARTLHLEVPKDVSVIGYDDSISMSSMTPTLTTVRQPVDKISRSIVNGLSSMIDDDTLAAKRDTLHFEPELVVRESTGVCFKR